MGQITKKKSGKTARRISLGNSLKWRILLYMPIPVLLAVLGTFQIGYMFNDIQAWYLERVFTGNRADVLEEETDPALYSIVYENGSYTIYETEDGVRHYIFHNVKSPGTTGEKIGYELLNVFQVVLIILWIVLCLFAGGYFYYKREMEHSIKLLLHSAEQITDNRLDFEMEKTKPNELGLVCDAFEKMRTSLLETSRENFRILEERRRLNAAFAHDMRNPITVLKGYADMLERYVPERRISQEKEMEMVGMMRGQILRLENYVRKMSAVQKLEDITPSCKEVDFGEFILACTRTAELLDGRVSVRTEGKEGTENMTSKICIDEELVLEVLENLISNASAYAKDQIILVITHRKDSVELRVEDDGDGFSGEALQMAETPFYREESRKDGQHLGMGLYICKLICRKCGGGLLLENGPGGTGGIVTAVFSLSLEKADESR